jgi:hypothetical protein
MAQIGSAVLGYSTGLNCRLPLELALFVHTSLSPSRQFAPVAPAGARDLLSSAFQIVSKSSGTLVGAYYRTVSGASGSWAWVDSTAPVNLVCSGLSTGCNMWQAGMVWCHMAWLASVEVQVVIDLLRVYALLLRVLFTFKLFLTGCVGRGPGI